MREHGDEAVWDLINPAVGGVKLQTCLPAGRYHGRKPVELHNLRVTGGDIMITGMATDTKQKKVEKLMEQVALRVFQKMLRSRRVSELVRLAQEGGSFDFLMSEPDLYSLPPKHEKG